MNVLKFGGTSVGTIGSLSHVKAIVESRREPVVVVVSALGGLTDKIISIAQSAPNFKDDFKNELASIRKRHFDIIEALVAKEKQKKLKGEIETLLQDLSNIFEGIRLVGEVTKHSLDQAVSFGERMSSLIVADIIREAVFLDSLQIVKTEKWFNKDIAETRLTTELIKKEIKPEVNKVTVLGGFISTDKDTGQITNLGRGGSDFTAALIAAALDADELEIWTDVDGFMTADPRIIPDARIIDKMTFIESMELCSFGAKVIYPPTIYPVFHKNIPIRILNTFNPTAPGTYIDDVSRENEYQAKGVSSISNISLVAVKFNKYDNFLRLNSRSYNAMAKKGINVLLVSHPKDDGDFSFAINTSDSEKALETMRNEFGPEIANDEISDINVINDMAIIAVVGENISSHKGLEARISNTLQRSGIKVFAASHGASTTNYSFVVDNSMAHEALRLIHETIFN